MKGYTVFNVEQIEGLPPHFYATAAPQIDPVQRIRGGRPVLRQHRGRHPPRRESGLLRRRTRLRADAAFRVLRGCRELLLDAGP